MTIPHGGIDRAELRRLDIDPATLLDFSVCVNPFGPSPRVRQALANASTDQYPDREAHALRAALAVKLDIKPRRILVGNGVSELIWLAALAFAQPGARVLVIGPTYGEYARAASLQGAVLCTWTARPDDRFGIDAEAIENKLKAVDPAVVFVCNPNNPTGSVLAPDAILAWARRNPRTLFVVDEAYQGFVAGLASVAPADADNVLVLRSMTKDYALAGLRIGYAVGSTQVIAALERVRPPWSVNSFAQEAAAAALADDAHVTRSLALLDRAKVELTAGLVALGLDVWPSATHYFLVRVGDGAALRLKLLLKGVQLRDAASFGLPQFVRVATRRPDENARLLAAWREVL
jgi:histidinol-phosphate aminotransferase